MNQIVTENTLNLECSTKFGCEDNFQSSNHPSGQVNVNVELNILAGIPNPFQDSTFQESLLNRKQIKGENAID